MDPPEETVIPYPGHTADMSERPRTRCATTWAVGCSTASAR